MWNLWCEKQYILSHNASINSPILRSKKVSKNRSIPLLQTNLPSLMLGITSIVLRISVLELLSIYFEILKVCCWTDEMLFEGSLSSKICNISVIIKVLKVINNSKQLNCVLKGGTGVWVPQRSIIVTTLFLTHSLLQFTAMQSTLHTYHPILN